MTSNQTIALEKTKLSKNRQKQMELINSSKTESLNEILELLFKVDKERKSLHGSSVDLAINLRPAKKKKPIVLVSFLTFPHNPDIKKPSIGVFATGEKAEIALAAGANQVGDVDFINEVKNGKIIHDYYIASKDISSMINSIARVLGPRGLFPNTKNNTLTDDIKGSIQTILAGQRDVKKPVKSSVVHIPIGNTLMTIEQVKENIMYLFKNLFLDTADSRLKQIVNNIYISSSQSPSLLLPVSMVM